MHVPWSDYAPQQKTNAGVITRSRSSNCLKSTWLVMLNSSLFCLFALISQRFSFCLPSFICGCTVQPVLEICLKISALQTNMRSELRFPAFFFLAFKRQKFQLSFISLWIRSCMLHSLRIIFDCELGRVVAWRVWYETRYCKAICTGTRLFHVIVGRLVITIVLAGQTWYEKWLASFNHKVFLTNGSEGDKWKSLADGRRLKVGDRRRYPCNSEQNAEQWDYSYTEFGSIWMFWDAVQQSKAFAFRIQLYKQMLWNTESTFNVLFSFQKSRACVPSANPDCGTLFINDNTTSKLR